MTVNQLIDLIEKRVNNASTVSAYLEYTNMSGALEGNKSRFVSGQTDTFLVLRHDIEPLPLIHSYLKEAHCNVWLSDGHTLGKLHNDAFDNILAMVKNGRLD